MKTIFLVLLVAIGALLWQNHSRDTARNAALAKTAVQLVDETGVTPPYVSARAADAPAAFSCDGRTRCSQMHSCAEANYFLKNCPGTKMDGDNDGIPCEQQWCQG